MERGRLAEKFGWGPGDITIKAKGEIMPLGQLHAQNTDNYGGGHRPDDRVYSMFDADGGDVNRPLFLAARDAGQRIKVDEATFYYFLEVLPPVSMGETYELRNSHGFPQLIRTSFGFAEGSEEITAFWKAGGNYWCQKTGIRNRV